MALEKVQKDEVYLSHRFKKIWSVLTGIKNWKIMKEMILLALTNT